MASSATVTCHSQVTIPKEIREAIGINEGDTVRMKVVESNKILIEKSNEDVWKDCSDFLPKDYEELLSSMHKDSRISSKKLGLIP